jgi:hypothetical protein
MDNKLVKMFNDADTKKLTDRQKDIIVGMSEAYPALRELGTEYMESFMSDVNKAIEVFSSNDEIIYNQ